MGVKLTNHQFDVVKRMTGFCEAFANQLYHIMKNHGLDQIDGCSVSITVTPKHDYTTMDIVVGTPDTDFGYIDLARGKADEKYAPIGKNSAEYELLFADEAVRSRMEKVLHREKPLPPDGLWVGSSRNSDPVDGWEWDINDSLS